nr:hypothetical protein [Jeotgalibacillus malaysiensis]
MLNNVIAILFVFVITFFISATLNIFLKTTSKIDWAITLLLCMGLSVILVGVLG